MGHTPRMDRIAAPVTLMIWSGRPIQRDGGTVLLPKCCAKSTHTYQDHHKFFSMWKIMVGKWVGGLPKFCSALGIAKIRCAFMMNCTLISCDTVAGVMSWTCKFGIQISCKILLVWPLANHNCGLILSSYNGRSHNLSSYHWGHHHESFWWHSSW